MKNSIIDSEIEQYIIDIRRDLHKIPELAFEEEKTIAYIKREIEGIIEKSPLNISLVERKGGLVVDLLTNTSLKRLLFRADIDALPITEETGLEFSSTHPGKMHACGHDMHASMLLGALKAISLQTIESKHNLRFVWQRSEERKVNGISGGEMLVNEGVLDDVDEVYAMHILPTAKIGEFLSRPGSMMANTNQFHIEIKTTGGHVARPGLGTNAIDVLLEMQNAARGSLERFLHSYEDAILVPSIIQAGNISNIRPASGKCCFVFRHYLSDERAEKFRFLFTKKIEGIVKSYEDCTISMFSYIQGYPMLKNSPDSVKKVKSLLEKQGTLVSVMPFSFGGEDFSYYLQKKPGSLWFLGVMGSHAYDLHTPKMNPDEGAMIHGVHFWLLLASHE